MKKITLSLSVLFASSTLFGLTLQESVDKVLTQNPAIQAKIKEVDSIKKSLDIEKSGNYPSIDLSAAISENKSGHLNNDVNDESYFQYYGTVTLTQNIFDGYKTSNRIDYQKNKLLSASYDYLDSVNELTYNTVESYLNVFRNKELLLAVENSVNVNKGILDKVTGLYDSGIKVISDVNKIHATYALSVSNLNVRKQNLNSSKIKLENLVGANIELEKLEKATIDFSTLNLSDKNNILEEAKKNNPILLLGRYNVESAKSLNKESRSDYYPTVDIQLSQTYKDQSETNSFSSPDDQASAMITLKYNLYNGGSKKEKEAQSLINVQKEKFTNADSERKIEEDVKQSFSTIKALQEQIKYLNIYYQKSEEALDLYKKEYELGRRSLLDLLAVHNDLVNANIQITNATYDLELAKYKLAKATAKIVPVVTGENEKYKTKW